MESLADNHERQVSLLTKEVDELKEMLNLVRDERDRLSRKVDKLTAEVERYARVEEASLKRNYLDMKGSATSPPSHEKKKRPPLMPSSLGLEDKENSALKAGAAPSTGSSGSRSMKMNLPKVKPLALEKKEHRQMEPPSSSSASSSSQVAGECNQQ